LAAHCAKRIAGYKKPRVVQFVKELPRNATGKVVKPDWRDSINVARDGLTRDIDVR
jgi:acyl-coenzyme A synthetase/AMP-(fatty) acid ligase